MVASKVRFLAGARWVGKPDSRIRKGKTMRETYYTTTVTDDNGGVLIYGFLTEEIAWEDARCDIKRMGVQSVVIGRVLRSSDVTDDLMETIATVVR